MTPSHEEWQELILAYEDLAPEERAQAGEHLAACATCRALLARLQEIERAPGPLGSLPDLAGAAQRLTPEEAREAAASLAAMRQRLGLSAHDARAAGAALRARGWLRPLEAALRPLGTLLSRRSAPRLLIPVAAAAALIVVAMRLLPQPGPGVHDLQLIPAATLRGDERSAGRESGASVTDGRNVATSGERVWRTGESFFLRFTLARDGFPVVFHVDPAGRIALLHPEGPAAALVRVPGGMTTQLPPASSGDEWAFEGEPGSETFLVAVTARARVDLAGLLEEARRAAGDSAERDRAVIGLEALLADRLGPVASLSVRHAP